MALHDRVWDNRVRFPDASLPGIWAPGGKDRNMSPAAGTVKSPLPTGLANEKGPAGTALYPTQCPQEGTGSLQ